MRSFSVRRTPATTPLISRTGTHQRIATETLPALSAGSHQRNLPALNLSLFDPVVDERRTKVGDTKIKGTIDKAKGKARETAGKVTGKRSTQAKGKAEQLKGSAKEKLG
jgi:uncharacterized protein YjbJ (UPF0337 family)